MYNLFLDALKEWDISINSSILLFIGVFLAVRLVIWVFGAVGVHKIAEKENKKLNYCFVPFLYPLAIGKLAEEKKDDKKPTKFGGLLLTLFILKVIFGSAFLFVSGYSFITITNFALKAIETDSAMTIGMFSSAIYVIILFFIALAVYICYYAVYCTALCKIYKRLDKRNAGLYTFFSVILRFASPLFILLVSKKNKEETFGFTFEE